MDILDLVKYLTNTNSGNTDIMPFLSLAILAICAIKSTSVPSVKYLKKLYEHERIAKSSLEYHKKTPYGW